MTDETMPILPQLASEFEYCMVFSITQVNKKNTDSDQPVYEGDFGVLLSHLHSVGIITQMQESRDGDEMFLFLTTTLKKFEKYAEILGILKPLKAGSDAPFKRKGKEAFEGYVAEKTWFTSYQRSLIMLHLIQAPASRGGAAIDIAKGIAKGRFSKCFPLHDPKEKAELLREWVRRSYKESLSQKFDKVRGYYGEYITIYFAWLEHYTRWLGAAAIPGFILGIVGFAMGFDNPTVPFYCLFVAFWATLYLESWKRKNATLVSEWGVTRVQQEQVRAAFQSERSRRGAYVNGVFLDLQDLYDAELKNGGKPKIYNVDWSSSQKKWGKYGVAFSALVTFLGVVIVATFGLVAARLFLSNTPATKSWTPIIGGILNAVTIIILNLIYSKIAAFLTEWENHRTEGEWERSFIVKSFLFQFVNSYISLVYTAFIKQYVDLFGVAKAMGLDIAAHQCLNNNCLGETASLLGTIFLTNIFVGQTQEIAIPWIKSKVFMYLEDRSMRTRNQYVEASDAEKESKLTYYESTFDDYNEMAIQFGYVTLWAAAFPWAPVAAFVNNVIELRTDALKLLTGMQRTHPKSASDIGIWLQILEIINYAAVLTNCGLIFLTSNWVRDNLKWEPSDLFLAALICEHAILIIKWALSVIIPDVPTSVLRKEALKSYNRHKLIEKYADKHSLADILSSDVFIDEGLVEEEDVNPAHVQVRLE